METQAAQGVKIKQNQLVKRSTLLSALALFAAVGLLVGPMTHDYAEQTHRKNIAMAQSAAFQAWELFLRQGQQQPANRGLASVTDDLQMDQQEGQLGADSSGAAFHYKIRSEDTKHVIDVWSEGPDGVRTQVVIPPGFH